jgi:hypothetical protein
MVVVAGSHAPSLSTKVYLTSATGRTKYPDAFMRLGMARMPNQIEGEHYGLLQQIARCRRLAKEIHDQVTVERLLALAAEYEQKLNKPPSEE